MGNSNPSSSLASLSPDGKTAVIDLSRYDAYRGYPVDSLELLRSPPGQQPIVDQDARAAAEQQIISNVFYGLAANYFNGIAHYFMKDKLSSVKLYIKLKQGEDILQFVLSFTEIGMCIDASDPMLLLPAYNGANGKIRQKVDIRPDLTWQQLHQAIANVQDKKFNVLGNPSHSHFQSITKQVQQP